MWAAAALQNLAASYCDTQDGRCSWRWSGDPGAMALEPHEALETSEALLTRLPPILLPKQSVAEAAGTAELVSSRCSYSAAQLAPLQPLTPLRFCLRPPTCSSRRRSRWWKRTRTS